MAFCLDQVLCFQENFLYLLDSSIDNLLIDFCRSCINTIQSYAFYSQWCLKFSVNTMASNTRSCLTCVICGFPSELSSPQIYGRLIVVKMFCYYFFVTAIRQVKLAPYPVFLVSVEMKRSASSWSISLLLKSRKFSIALFK